LILPLVMLLQLTTDDDSDDDDNTARQVLAGSVMSRDVRCGTVIGRMTAVQVVCK